MQHMWQTFNEKTGSQTTFFLDNSHDFCTSNSVFYAYSYMRDFHVAIFVFFGENLSFPFIDRSYDVCAFLVHVIDNQYFVKVYTEQEGI